MVITPREGSYDVMIHKTLEHEELPAETVIGCEITIAGTEYFLREEAIYHHRGKRSSDMEKIRKLQEIRARKSSVFYNTDSRYNMDFMDNNQLLDYNSASKNFSLASIIKTIAVLFLRSLL